MDDDVETLLKRLSTLLAGVGGEQESLTFEFRASPPKWRLRVRGQHYDADTAALAVQAALTKHRAVTVAALAELEADAEALAVALREGE